MQNNKHLEKLSDAIVSGNIPQIVMSAISHGLVMRSSDIHIEPEEKVVRIRLRIDGILHPIIEYPNNIHLAVVSRVKIMSNLKIDEQRIPQDGRIKITTEDHREIDLRVSTLPTINGEKICMRIQDRSKKIPELEQLGVTAPSLEYIKNGIRNPNGIILTTGPTGSGKTTTLYSCLQMLNTTDVNIMTLEDPTEIQVDGLNQSQVKPTIGYSFANGLRTALRQDPDIIMVGEIRDKETIEVAIEASLTGHLVLSTIHTNSSIETLNRIRNMGIPTYLMTATIQTIISQRLIRTLNPETKKPRSATQLEKEDILQTVAQMPEQEKRNIPQEQLENIVLYEAENQDAYLGREGIYEVLAMTDTIRKMILDDKSTLEIKKAAVKEGMLTLKQAGILKVLAGKTTLEEVYRIAK